MENAEARPKIDRTHEQCEMQLPALVVLFIRTIPKQAEAVQALIMRPGIVVNVTRADRRRLKASYLLGAIMLWEMFYCFQREFAAGFMEELWLRIARD